MINMVRINQLLFARPTVIPTTLISVPVLCDMLQMATAAVPTLMTFSLRAIIIHMMTMILMMDMMILLTVVARLLELWLVLQLEEWRFLELLCC